MRTLLASVFVSCACAAAAAPAWTVSRDSSRERATATAGARGATMNALAAAVGLDARVWERWVTVPETVRLADGTQAPSKGLGPAAILAPGQTVQVPNTVIAAWIGDFGDLARAAVGWNADIDYLRERGFAVVVLDKPEADDHLCTGPRCGVLAAFGRRLVAALQGAAQARDLHGFFATSHGNCRGIGDKKTTLVRVEDFRNIYPLALLIVNACEADTWSEQAAPGGKFHGPGGLMIPPFETGHPDELLKPGEQGTRTPPRRRPARRTS